MPASRPASGQAGAVSRGENVRAGAGAAAGLLRPPGAVHGVPQGDSGRPAVHTCLFLRGITFLLRFGRWRPAVPGADGSRSRAAASACGSFSHVVVFCRIVFPGEAVHCPAVPVPFRREEKFRCQISPSSLSLPRWTGCLTRRCARS